MVEYRMHEMKDSMVIRGSTREKVEELRSMGMSSAQIARECGVSRQRVHQLLSGYLPPKHRPYGWVYTKGGTKNGL